MHFDLAKIGEQNAYKLLVPKRLQERDKMAQVQAQQQNETKKRRSKTPEPVAPPVVQEVHIKQDRTSLVNYFYSYVSSYYNVLLMTSFVPLNCLPSKRSAEKGLPQVRIGLG